MVGPLSEEQGWAEMGARRELGKQRLILETSPHLPYVPM